MDCHQAANLINASIDGELDTDGRALLDAHLAQCPDCRAAAGAARAQDVALHSAFESRRAAADRLAERVDRQLYLAMPRPRTQSAWLPSFLGMAAGFLLAVVLFRPWQDDRNRVAVRPETAARVALATGPVNVQPLNGGAWTTCSTSAVIEPGATLRTAPHVRCELTTTDGSEVFLNGNTQVRFESGRAMELDQGQLWSAVPNVGAPLEVAAAEATIVASNARFCLDRSPDQTLLTVVEGTATVQGSGAPKTIAAGERAKIVAGQVAETTRLDDPILDTSWIHEILVLKRPDDRELSRRVDQLLARIGRAKLSVLYEDEIRRLGDRAVEPLIRFIESSRADQEQSARVRAARIVADVAQPRSIRDLIRLTADPNPDVRIHAAQGLVRLTGRDLGLAQDEWRGDRQTCQSAHEAWRQWWEQNKHRYPGSPRTLAGSSRRPLPKGKQLNPKSRLDGRFDGSEHLPAKRKQG